MTSLTNINSILSLKDALVAASKESALFDRSELVFGEGLSPSKVVIVGEAPGRTEAEEGRPFVGKAGVFFTTILEEVMERARGELYITNVVKIWPHLTTKRGRTRPPTKAEFDFFLPFLRKELALLSPRAVVAVGKTAFSALVPAGDFIPGRWHDSSAPYRVMALYHPAYLLRKQRSLDETTRDMKRALAEVREFAFGA